MLPLTTRGPGEAWAPGTLPHSEQALHTGTHGPLIFHSLSEGAPHMKN